MFSLACAMKLCHLSRCSILASPGTNESLGKPNNVGVVLPEVGAGSGEVGKWGSSSFFSVALRM